MKTLSGRLHYIYKKAQQRNILTNKTKTITAEQIRKLALNAYGKLQKQEKKGLIFNLRLQENEHECLITWEREVK